MPPKQYLHEETEPHMGMELVCTSAGENFSFNRFHCTKTGNATFLRAICWDVKGGLSCRTGPSKGTAIHRQAIIQGIGFLYDTLFFNLFLTMTSFVFDARVWAEAKQRLGMGSEEHMLADRYSHDPGGLGLCVSGWRERKKVGPEQSQEHREGKVMESRLASLCQVLVLHKNRRGPFCPAARSTGCFAAGSRWAIRTEGSEREHFLQFWVEHSTAVSTRHRTGGAVPAGPGGGREAVPHAEQWKGMPPPDFKHRVQSWRASRWSSGPCGVLWMTGADKGVVVDRPCPGAVQGWEEVKLGH